MKNTKPIKFLPSFLLFFIYGLIFSFNIYYLIPWIIDKTNINPFIITQVVNTFLLFIPIFITAFVLLKNDGIKLDWNNIKKRLFLKKLRLNDIFWVLGGLFVATVIIILLVYILNFLPISFKLTKIEKISPITLKPLHGKELYFLLFMPISFFFNYVGEEILWRGYLYPRQEIIFEDKTWIINGLLHALFHLYMGIYVFLFLPLLLVIPFVFRKTRNLYTVIIMHALLGAPTDILLALGILK